MESFKAPKNLSFNDNVAENWRKFRQNFEIYMLATGNDKKSPEIKVAILLNIVGEEAVEVFNTFNLTEEQKKNYDIVVKKFEEFCIPKKNIVYERYLFYTRSQKDGESFDYFYTEIKKLVKTCEFGEQRDSMLRDRVVLGIRDKELQERMLRIRDLDLSKATDMCKAAELVKTQARDLQEGRSVDIVKKREKTNTIKSENVKAKQTTDGEFLCKRCNRKHKSKSCPAYGKICINCGKYNHFAVSCHKEKNKKRIDNVQQDTGESENEFVINSVANRNINAVSWSQCIQVENKLIKFKLDTGAEVNVISKNVLDRIQYKNKIRTTSHVIEAYGSFNLNPLGIVNLKCSHNNIELYEDFVVINNSAQPLLGLDTCLKLNLIKKLSVNSLVSKSDFINKNLEVFEGLGKFEGKCRINLKVNSTPVVRPPRRVPLTLRDRLKDTLLELEKRE